MPQKIVFADYVNSHTLYLVTSNGTSLYYSLARFLHEDIVAQALLEQDVYVDADGGLSWPTGLSVHAHHVILDSVTAPSFPESTDI